MLGLRLWWVAGARFLVMPAVERGLEVLALVFLVVVRLRDGSVEMAATTRGLELPVVLRVEAIVGAGPRYRMDGCTEEMELESD